MTSAPTDELNGGLQGDHHPSGPPAQPPCELNLQLQGELKHLVRRAHAAVRPK